MQFLIHFVPLIGVVDPGQRHQYVGDIALFQPVFFQQRVDAAHNDAGRLGDIPLEVFMVAAAGFDRGQHLFFLIEQGVHRLGAAAVDADIIRHTYSPSAVSVKKSSQTSSRQ